MAAAYTRQRKRTGRKRWRGDGRHGVARATSRSGNVDPGGRDRDLESGPGRPVWRRPALLPRAHRPRAGALERAWAIPCNMNALGNSHPYRDRTRWGTPTAARKGAPRRDSRCRRWFVLRPRLVTTCLIHGCTRAWPRRVQAGIRSGISSQAADVLTSFGRLHRHREHAAVGDTRRAPLPAAPASG